MDHSTDENQNNQPINFCNENKYKKPKREYLITNNIQSFHSSVVGSW